MPVAEKSQDRSLEQLNGLMARVRANVPFHAERLGDKPVRSLAEFAELPFTTKEDFRSTYPFGLFAVPLEEVVRLHQSSGTTGKPVIVGYTAGDLDCWGDAMARILGSAGVASTDVFQNVFPYGVFTGGHGYQLGAERLGVTVVPTGAGVTHLGSRPSAMSTTAFTSSRTTSTPR